MRLRRPQVAAPVYAIPGLVIFQALFQRLRLKERRARVLSGSRTVAYLPHKLVMMLVVHLLLGFRRLRERDYYRDDPIVQRVLGLRQLPDVTTWTRGLAVWISSPRFVFWRGYPHRGLFLAWISSPGDILTEVVFWRVGILTEVCFWVSSPGYPHRGLFFGACSLLFVRSLPDFGQAGHCWPAVE